MDVKSGVIVDAMKLLESLTPTFLNSSPTMFSADILADVVRGVPVRPSPEETTLLRC